MKMDIMQCKKDMEFEVLVDKPSSLVYPTSPANIRKGEIVRFINHYSPDVVVADTLGSIYYVDPVHLVEFGSTKDAIPIPHTEGIKFDSGKPKLSLLTPESLAYEANAFNYGMKKYAKGNYKLGMDWSRVADAALRHMTAWANKEDFDKESSLSHLAHAKACIAMLIYYVENKKGTDDR